MTGAVRTCASALRRLEGLTGGEVDDLREQAQRGAELRGEGARG